MTTARTEAHPSVVVIVLDCDGADFTIPCVRSLAASTYPNFEVFVVCNGEDSEQIQRIRGVFPDLRVFETGRNLGYAGGMNHGMHQARESQPDWFLLLNNDTQAPPELLRSLHRRTTSRGGSSSTAATPSRETSRPASSATSG